MKIRIDNIGAQPPTYIGNPPEDLDNRLVVEVMMLKEQIKEFKDTLTVCIDNFSCKTFVPQKWELPPYDEQGKGTPIE